MIKEKVVPKPWIKRMSIVHESVLSKDVTKSEWDEGLFIFNLKIQVKIFIKIIKNINTKILNHEKCI